MKAVVERRAHQSFARFHHNLLELDRVVLEASTTSEGPFGAAEATLPSINGFEEVLWTSRAAISLSLARRAAARRGSPSSPKSGRPRLSERKRSVVSERPRRAPTAAEASEQML